MLILLTFALMRHTYLYPRLRIFFSKNHFARLARSFLAGILSLSILFTQSGWMTTAAILALSAATPSVYADAPTTLGYE